MTTPNANTSEESDARKVVAHDFLPCLWMLLGILGVFPLFAAYGYTRYELVGVFSAATAATVVLIGMEAALVLTIMFRDTDFKIPSVLLGTFFRTGIPLVFGMLMHTAGGPLAEAGLFGMILVYYLLTLGVETVLAVQLVSQTSIFKKAA
ncbi:hypothetical protein DTL21_14460 [Bremerella cremea]|uniref:Uncharacterized protein n=1 Tax=Blastopirellula marina TaxID=124 RepID=A0A2S8FRA0_9BACT|nr:MULTISPECIES: hypothetical protein [Pirellulaceae]PQO34702.1 hypothetical protein C5Y83_14455 [Blastopirellula marina]RCS47200.1 hypothetical protein DTL21_14460 [Bremerella cremea]